MSITASPEDFVEILGKIEQRAEKRGEKIRIIQEWQTVVKAPVVSKDMSAEPARLIRPLLKIAYEIATDWLGATYARDPTAVALRRAICSGHVEDIDAEVGYFPPLSAFRDWAVPSTSHAVAMWTQGGHGYVAIRVFNVIEARVRVTDAFANYEIQPMQWIVLDPIRACVAKGFGVPSIALESTTSIAWAEVEPGAFEVRTFYEGLESTRTSLALSYGV